MWLSARIGASLLRRFRKIDEDARDDFSVIQAATLTLLALIIGFTFSMAVGRYDQRKNYEEEEANAIGTEYVRADLLPAADAAIVRGLLKTYLDERVLFYTTRDADELAKVNAETSRLQDEMWSAVKNAAAAQPTPVAALAVAGMNDVLNTQGYTQAAWWNRIPCRGVGADGVDRGVRQRAGRLRRARFESGSRLVADRSADRVAVVHAGRRYR